MWTFFALSPERREPLTAILAYRPRPIFGDRKRLTDWLVVELLKSPGLPSVRWGHLSSRFDAGWPADSASHPARAEMDGLPVSLHGSTEGYDLTRSNLVFMMGSFCDSIPLFVFFLLVWGRIRIREVVHVVDTFLKYFFLMFLNCFDVCCNKNIFPCVLMCCCITRKGQ